MSVNAKDRQFLAHCEIAKRDSHDPSRQVGAVIVGAGETRIAMGANRPPEVMGLSYQESVENIRINPTWKYFIFEHAERNAIQKAQILGISLKGATIYVTLFPCADCARAIVSSGINRIVVFSSASEVAENEKWLEHFRYAEEIFQRAGTAVDMLSPIEVVANSTALF